MSYKQWIKQLRCLCERFNGSECKGVVHPHHVRRFTGLSLKPKDEGNLVPLCWNHHTGNKGIHNMGKKTFAKRYALDLQQAAKMLHELYLKHKGAGKVC